MIQKESLDQPWGRWGLLGKVVIQKESLDQPSESKIDASKTKKSNLKTQEGLSPKDCSGSMLKRGYKSSKFTTRTMS